MTIYRPPFDPYCQRQEAKDPYPLNQHWNGCWTFTLARSIDGITGGAVSNLKEADIRAACGVIDHGLSSDGGTLANQITALSKLAPKGTWYSLRPTKDEFRAHLGAGGIAIMAGWESDAPASDRAYDPAFYDRKGSNGHSNYCQGVGDGVNVFWGNPERFMGMADPIVPIDAALKFVWDAQNGAAGRVEALLLKSFTIQDQPRYVPVPGTTYVPLDNNADARVYDSRTSGVPLANHAAFKFKVTGHGGVPAGATAVTGNLTVTQATGAGYLALGPTSRNDPTNSSLNFPVGDDRANGGTWGLAADGTLAVTYVTTRLGATAHFVFDATGYFTA